MEKLTLSEYYDILEAHDWYYYFSDEGKVHARGEPAQARIEELSSQSVEHRKLLKAFKDHMFSGKPWNTEQKPKPDRPLEGV